MDPVFARLEQAIEFQFETPYEIRPEASKTVLYAPPVAVIGPQTARHYTVFIKGPVDAFAIIFQPAGFYRLFKIPLSEFVDEGTEATAVFGSAIMQLRERLGELTDFGGRIRIAEEYLVQKLQSVDSPDPFSNVAACLLRVEGGATIIQMASETSLSLRHFERRFHRYTGVTPKLFAKIARFQAALEEKRRFPSHSWTTVAHSNGYFDQMHLIRDFRELGGAKPSRVTADLSPEHINHLLDFVQDVA